MGVLNFFKCVGRAVLGKGLRGLAGLVPFGELLWDVAEDAGKRLKEKRSDAEVRAEVAAVAQLPGDQGQKAADTAVAEIAANQPREIKLALSLYLSQLPASIRQSLKRPTDPTGTSVPATFSINRPEEVLALLPQRLPRFRPGDRPAGIGEWQLLDLLGVGGFGEVWKARHVHFDGTLAAIKFCLDPSAQDRLLRHEATVLNQIMRQGGHPGVVPLLDANLSADPPWLRYEYIEGGDLAQIVRRAATLPGLERVNRASQVIRRLASIVGHFHRLNPPVVHRDLKPANVLLQRQSGGKFALRVADFGIGGVAARRALDEASRAPTCRGDLLATVLRGAHTPLYASPQQKRGNDPDVRDDVYSLGVIWYQLLTGDLGSERPGGLDWVDELKEAGMSDEGIRLLGRCVEDKPERRPANAGILAEEIAKLSVAVIQTQPPSSPPPARKPGELFTNSLGMKFAWIPPGTFLMGSPPDEEGRGDNETQHSVTLTPGFFMGLVPTTRGQFAQFVKQRGYQTDAERKGGAFFGTGKKSKRDPSKNWLTPDFDQTDEHPVVCVNWDDTVAFCEWLTRQDQGDGLYRLPTEAQWEYACRAGTTTPFHFGETIGVDQANYDGRSVYGKSRKGLYRERTTPAGSFPPNAWGLFDMHGNVCEWCQDRNGDESDYPVGPAQNPEGPSRGKYRCMRGGSWGDLVKDCRSAFRGYWTPGEPLNWMGFRVVFCPD